MNNHLIIYAKRPIAGYSKTRLAAGIGAEEAAGVYARLLYSLLTDINNATWKSPLQGTISLASADDKAFFKAAFPEWEVTNQITGDLGQRMCQSIQAEFVAGAEKVVLTGSDIPFLSHHHIRQAFDALNDTELVFGPTDDGGFYLVGTTISELDIFNDIQWSTSSVLSDCIDNARRKGYTTTNIAELYDMDTEREYFTWQQRLMGRTT